MDITPIVSERAQQIQRYGNGVFVISGEEYRGGVIVTHDRTVAWHISMVDEQAIALLVEHLVDSEILLIGTGKQMQRLSPELRQSIKSYGINIDVMDTGAACRTYNILMSEGRKVVAALIAI